MSAPVLLVVAAALLFAPAVYADDPVPANPILFVTQVPTGEYAAVTAVFGNIVTQPANAPRGGDLMLRYPDGTLRFLTAEAGYGDSGMQGANAIAVREPSIHWSGAKALFSMLVGAPTQKYQVVDKFWQIYEVTGFAPGETASIRKIAGQPANFNNLSPIYGTDDRILFISDRPRSGAAHHYPQLDEYESDRVVAGIYSLDEDSGEMTLLEHAPSGVTSLSIDSFGRVIFTKWDHLQRDQQGDAPLTAAAYEAFTWESEDADAATTTSLIGAEIFPEPRSYNDPAYDSALELHPFNHFFPWEMNEDGTAEETLNHIGRHELGGSFSDGSFKADPNLTYIVPDSLHANQLHLGGSAGLFHAREDPTSPGDFFLTYAQEFDTASGGTLMRLTGAPAINPDDMVLSALTPTSADAQVPQQTGYFRNPLPMSDGSLIAAHTPATGYVQNLGSTALPNWNYEFRLKLLESQGAFFVPTANLTSGIAKLLTWWTPDAQATYSGNLWELDPVEVVARPVPPPRTSKLPAIEAGVFAQVGVDVAAFRQFLRDNGLALIVSRDVTQRDRADRNQPFNLQVPGGVSSIAGPGQVYDVAHLQIYQADAVRGYGNPAQPDPGRRLLPRPMHEPGVSQAPGAPQGAVAVAPDGSLAALVPAQRALTWQLTDPNGEGVVRERNWLSFQSGEIRVCGSCHGINKFSQTGETEPTNAPLALFELLDAWKLEQGGGEPDPTATPTEELPTPEPTPTDDVPPPAPTATVPAPAGCASGKVFTRAQLRVLGKSGRITFRGEAVVPEPWIGIDPPAAGIVLDFAGQELVIPGGAAWRVRANGKGWSYRDRAGVHGGVTSIELLNRTQRVPGGIAVRLRLENAALAPAAGATTLEIRFGTEDACAVAAWNGPAGAQPRCLARATTVMCR